MMTNEEFNTACARAAHEVNRVYCSAIGDDSQVPWESAPQWQRDSAVKGVAVALAGGSPEDSHRSWLDEKERTGWVYGPVKDADRKTHPCMLPYADLPSGQRAKDALYQATVRAVAEALEEGVR